MHTSSPCSVAPPPRTEYGEGKAEIMTSLVRLNYQIKRFVANNNSYEHV